MSPSLRRALALLLFTLSTLALAQDKSDADDGYIGYELNKRGDKESAIYETADTPGGVGILAEDPDIYLNASVSVGEIDIEVDNITAKVNLDAQVLKLLHFSAGVDASIDRVRLTIQDVKARVELEARLANVVEMVNSVLNSIDLNPIVATLGQDVREIINTTADTITDPVDESGNPLGQRSLDYNLEHNILYSMNDYSGRTHTNRVLAQNGSLFDVFLDNDGNENGRKVVGYYATDMEFNGHNVTISYNGEPREFELQYVYNPYTGMSAVSNIYKTVKGKVVRTQVIAESHGGADSVISDDDDPEL
ncbi:hypothetical protein MKZ38_002762 [Zalerion maritima]|uniref:Uncharacterized protein n=1 Tax=Zalerion maritima TaxID=339359 RepID=A0AAD5RV55_9PEZI|nr:hypothetical protein MKZ38_002762 [Zalerion maritima]